MNKKKVYTKITALIFSTLSNKAKLLQDSSFSANIKRKNAEKQLTMKHTRVKLKREIPQCFSNQKFYISSKIKKLIRIKTKSH